VHLVVDGSLPDLEAAFQLIHLYFTEPRADRAAFDRYLRRAIAYARARDADPDAEFSDSVATAITPRKPRQLSGTPAFVSAIELAPALRFWRERTHDASDFTMVIVGDVTLQRIRPLVEKYVASLPGATHQRNRTRPGPLPTSAPVRTFIRGTAQKSRTRLMYSDSIVLTPATHHTLKVLRDALSLALDDRLREFLGGTYGVDVNLTIEPGTTSRYALSAEFEADPDRIDSLATAATAEIERLKRFGPTILQLTKLKADLKDAEERGDRSNAYWATALAWHAQLGWPIDSITPYLHTAQAVTRPSIAESARTYLTSRSFRRVTMRPASMAKHEALN
jgi:zinc protease